MIHGTVAGRLGRDVEVKQSQGGKSFASLSVASTEYDNRKKEQVTVWVNVVCFGQTADFLGKYARKGSYVTCIGHIGLEQYDSNGSTRTALKMTADKVELGGSKAESHTEAPARSPKPAAKPAAEVADEDLDIPF